jgi:hypothetical protein
MSMNFDYEIYTKYREMAVTQPEQIRVGDVLFSNLYSGPLEVAEINVDEAGPVFFITRNGERLYFKDHNVGAAYNNWMLFLDEETAKECKKELVVNFFSDLDYEYEYEYDFGVDYDYG